MLISDIRRRIRSRQLDEFPLVHRLQPGQSIATVDTDLIEQASNILHSHHLPSKLALTLASALHKEKWPSRLQDLTESIFDLRIGRMFGRLMGHAKDRISGRRMDLIIVQADDNFETDAEIAEILEDVEGIAFFLLRGEGGEHSFVMYEEQAVPEEEATAATWIPGTREVQVALADFHGYKLIPRAIRGATDRTDPRKLVVF